MAKTPSVMRNKATPHRTVLCGRRREEEERKGEKLLAAWVLKRSIWLRYLRNRTTTGHGLENKWPLPARHAVLLLAPCWLSLAANAACSPATDCWPAATLSRSGRFELAIGL